MKVPKQGQRRSGQGVAVPALGKPKDVVFDAPTYPWMQGKSGAPSSRVDTTMSRRMQTICGEQDDKLSVPRDSALELTEGKKPPLKFTKYGDLLGEMDPKEAEEMCSEPMMGRIPQMLGVSPENLYMADESDPSDTSDTFKRAARIIGALEGSGRVPGGKRLPKGSCGYEISGVMQVFRKQKYILTQSFGLNTLWTTKEGVNEILRSMSSDVSETLLHSFVTELIREDVAEDIIHLGLDACGLIPGAGEICDITNVVLYARKREWLNAVLSLISVIPEIGDLIGKGGKLALWFEKVAPKAAKTIAKHGPEVVNGIRTLKNLIRSNRQAVDSLLDDAESAPLISQYVPEMRQALDAFAGKARPPQIGEVTTAAAAVGYTLPLGNDRDDYTVENRRGRRKAKRIK